MANNATQSPSTPSKRDSFLNSAWGDLSGAVITVASGAVAAWRSINKSFYQNIKIAPEIGGALPEAGKEGATAEKITTKIPKEKMPVLERSKQETAEILGRVRKAEGVEKKRAILFPELRKQHLDHEKAMNTVLAEEYGIKGMFDKVKLLRPHQRWEVGVIVGATMAVALGAMLTLAGMSRTSDKQRELADRLTALENSPQR